MMNVRRIPFSARTLAIAAVYLALYVLLDGLTFIRPALDLAITPWHPQAGLTLAFLLLYGPRWWPFTAAAALLSMVGIHTIPASPLWVLGSSLWIAVAYATLAFHLRRWGLANPIRTASIAAQFAGACVAATLLIASGYVSLFVWSGVVPLADAMHGIARYWFGDLNGILMWAPLLIHATDWRESVQALKAHRRVILAQFASVLIALVIVFSLPAVDQLRFFYLLFVPVIWIALRWSLSGAIFSVLAIQSVLILAAWTGLHTPRFIDLQFLMLTLTLTALLLGAVVSERGDVLRRVAIRESEQRALLAMAPDAVLTVDASGHIQMANPAATRLFGERSQPVLTDLLPGLQLGASEGRASLDGQRKDGSHFPAEIAWARIDSHVNEGSLLTVRDVTDRRLAEEKLRERDAALARAMRFAVAGELASALAHELNQPITALVSYLRASEILTQDMVLHDDRLRAALSKAATEAIRASEVLRRLRDFYRGGAFKRERIAIPALCESVAKAFQDRLRRAEAALTLTLDPSIPELEGDSMQLEIVLHNLLANALDAVLHRPLPERRLELQVTSAEDAVTFLVEDSGPGITGDYAQMLFEPFVTSKPDGMGLGLAISRSLIRARGGDLSFAPSQRLGGAAFTVRIPIEAPAP